MRFADRAVHIPYSRFLRWAVVDRLLGRRRRPAPVPAPRRPSASADLANGRPPSVTWIGHATYLVRMNGRAILTDPVWGAALFVPRLVEPGLALAELPPLDAVLVSHAHYDHCSISTLKALQSRNPELTAFVPLGLGSVIGRAGIRRIVELDWWQSAPLGEIEIRLLPARHWSRRTLTDLNRHLWGGFLIAGERRVFFAGDTALDPLHEEIGARCRPIDAALLPIGAYDPEWFMRHQHLTPEDAGETFRRLGAKHFFAMHWGTFVLTDEPTSEPPARLRRWWQEQIWTDERLSIPAIGETVELA